MQDPMISKIVFAVAVDVAQIFYEQKNSGIQREQQRTKETRPLSRARSRTLKEGFQGEDHDWLLKNISPAAIINLQRLHQCLNSLRMRWYKKSVIL